MSDTKRRARGSPSLTGNHAITPASAPSSSATSQTSKLAACPGRAYTADSIERARDSEPA